MYWYLQVITDRGLDQNTWDEAQFGLDFLLSLPYIVSLIRVIVADIDYSVALLEDLIF